MSGIIGGFPQFPNDQLDPQIYNALMPIHLAIQNFNNLIGEATGIDAPDASLWSQEGVVGAFFTPRMTRIYVKAGAAIAAGQAVNLFNSAGTLKAQPAIATSAGTIAHGIANTAASTIDTYVEIQFMRGMTQLIGSLSPATIYYLSDTVAGAIMSGPPVTVGHISQPLGIAVDASTLLLDISLAGHTTI